MDNLRWIKKVLWHKWLVLFVGLKVGGISFWQLLVHDLSKLSIYEFPFYRDKFIKKNCADSDWEIAAHHHLSGNKHHWENWIYARTGQPLPMPEKYVREMVVDWMATSRELTGSWNISGWLEAEYPKMKLHSQTKVFLLGVP